MGMLMRRHFAVKKEDAKNAKDKVNSAGDTASAKRGRPKKKE